MANPKNAPKNDGPFEEVRIKDIMDAFHVSRQTVSKWIESGCPIKVNKRMSFYEVHRWILSRETGKLLGDGGSLKTRKLEKDIELMDTKIQKIRGTYILKEVMDSVLSARAKALAIYLQTGAIKNAIHYLGRTLEQIQAIRFEESQQAMSVYCGVSAPASEIIDEMPVKVGPDGEE